MRFIFSAALAALLLLVDTLTAICVGIGLAAFVFALVGRAILRRKFNARSDANEGQLWLLEFQLRSAILDATPRERLLKEAMRSTRGGRAAAIRKVLRDLEDETDPPKKAASGVVIDMGHPAGLRGWLGGRLWYSRIDLP
jgi:hypothetical protein